MSKLTKKNEEYWISDATSIKMDNIDKFLYRNSSVDEFLEYNKHFIVAEKGIGKTLLLKKKRYDLSKKPGFFIPSNSADLDIPTKFVNIPKNTIAILEKSELTEIIWKLAIELSAIKKYYYDESVLEEPDKSKLPDMFIKILQEEEFSTPSKIFAYLINDIFKTLQYYKNYNLYIDYLYEQIHSSIYIFIDRLDQAMLSDNYCTQLMWNAMQKGLLEAAWNLMNDRRKHIQIFCSMRQEIYNEYTSEVKGNLSGEICELTYNHKELHLLINTLSKYYEGETIEDIVKFGAEGKFIHDKTGQEETVFDYILRHTVSKPRDLVEIAKTLKKNITAIDTKKRIEELRLTVNAAAAKIAKMIFTEKERFLNCLKDENNRNNFFALIPKNTLSRKTVKKICAEFNGKNNCTDEQCHTDNCQHPFDELYNIGLLGCGRTDKPPKQTFKDINDGQNTNHWAGQYNYYVVHPCLYDIIKPLTINAKKIRYLATPGITTGNGLDWNKRYSEITDLFDIVFEADIPQTKKERIIEELKDTIKTTTNIKELTQKIKSKIRNIKQQHKNITIKKPHSKMSKRNQKQPDGIHILIASPSDVKTREYFLKEFANYFQQHNHEKLCGKRIFIHGWEEIASSLCYAQDKINEKIKQQIDIVVAIFKHRLGKPTIDTKTGTERAKSGTAEELLEYKKYKTYPMAYFCTEPPKTNILKEGTTEVEKKNNEWKRIEDFKKSIEREIFYKTYKKDNKDELFPLIAKNLEDNINEDFI